jgi:hypothetical protein
MHKNIKVMDIDIQEGTLVFYAINKIYSFEHVPLGIFKINDSDIIKLVGLFNWWNNRLIPDNRTNLRQILEVFGVRSTSYLAFKSLGLSLSDHYWLRPENFELNWEDINFFDNIFSQEACDIFLITNKNEYTFKDHGNNIEIRTPDSTTGGTLIKKWTNIDGISCLCKFGTPLLHQEPANEAIASLILDRLGVPHVPYSLKFTKDRPMSVCPNFLTRDTELVSAEWMLRTLALDEAPTPRERFLLAAERLEVPGAREALDEMLCFDFIIGNEDRHFNNFGLVRDATTLKPLGMAPIFDNGYSLCHQQATSKISIDEDVNSLPFESEHSRQINLVSDCSRLNLKSVKDIDNIFLTIYGMLPDFPQERIIRLIEWFKGRIEILEKIAN